MFQPEVNHRNTNPRFFHSQAYDQTHKKYNPAMMSSLINRKDNEHFTNDCPITLQPYELAAFSPEDEIPLIRSIRTHHDASVFLHDAKTFTSKGMMRGLMAYPLTPDSFADLCKLFGYLWKPRETYPKSDMISYSDMVRMEDWEDFLSIFSPEDCIWRDQASFEGFLNKFPTYFVYDNDLELRQNINLFSFYLRSLVKVRVSVPDGQHRAQILCYSMFGNFDIRANFPLREYLKNQWNGFPFQEGRYS